MGSNIFTAVIILLSVKLLTGVNIKNTDVANCTVYRDSLASALSAFTYCSIQYSRPVKFCESCVDMIIGVIESYQNLSTTRDDKDLCINNYIHLDRLEILLTLYDNSYNLWTRAKCNACFELVDGKLTNKFSTEMNTFNELYSNVAKCMSDNNLNATSLCKTCISDYDKLNKYYTTISNEYERIDICMDIVDVMNATRAFWSNNCCKFRHKDEAVFITATVLVITIVPLFYILAKLYVEKKIPVILKQSRFAGSFNPAIN